MEEMRYYGQCGEDLAVHTRYFPFKRNGVFLEMGALDGQTYSNTKFFEESMGWTGVLIEPLPQECAKIQSHRPNSRVYNNIVSTKTEPLEIYVNGAVSSVKDYTTQEYFDGWHKGNNIQTIQVPSRRLDSILHEAGVKRIDFWSLDVEGSELEVLQTMDWTIPVYVICLEVSGGESSEMNEKCRDILRANGFVLDGTVAHNELWVNPTHKPFRILCCDARGVETDPHRDWKEGYELMYAFRNLGHECDIAGPRGDPYTEFDISKIAHTYDLLVVTENYPELHWAWWEWETIRTRKLFWAIDTHVKSYPWLRKFDYVAYSILHHVSGKSGFWMPYGLSILHQKDDTIYPKEYDTIFMGNMLFTRRRELCDRFGIRHMEAFGPEYIKTMKKAKICFNLSITGDINAKYFEIMGSGTFLLTNYNQSLVDLFDGSPDLLACMYKTDEEIGEKMKYYLEHEDEREAIAKRLHDYVWTHHTWEARCALILEKTLSAATPSSTK